MKSTSSNSRRQRKSHVDRGGSVAVEFALTFPIVITFFFSGLVIIQALMMRDSAQHVAYEGARQAMLYGAEVDNVESSMASTLSQLRVNGADIYIDGINGSQVTVGVEISLQDNLWIGSSCVPDNWKVYSEISMKREID